MNIIDIMTTGQIDQAINSATGTDGHAIWNQAITGLDDSDGEMHWPGGFYNFTGTLEITGMPKRIVGSWGGDYTNFWFTEDNITGLFITSPGMMIERLTVRGNSTANVADGTDPNAHGIAIRTKTRLQDVTVLHFGGNGIDIQAPLDQGYNANSWKITDCTSSRNNGHGLFVGGDLSSQNSDTNAGVCIGLDTTANGGCGIWEWSFLGNTYIGCHSSSNGWLLSRAVHSGTFYYAGISIVEDTTVEPNPSMTTWDQPWKMYTTGADVPVTGNPSTYWPAWDSGNPYMYAPNYYSNAGETSLTDRTISEVRSWCAWIGCYSELGSAPDYWPKEHSIINGDLGGGVYAKGTYEIGHKKQGGQQIQTFRDPGFKEVDYVYLAEARANASDNSMFEVGHTHSTDSSFDNLALMRYENGTWPDNYLWQADRDVNKTAMGIIGPKGFPAGAFGRSQSDLSEGQVFFPSGMYIGNPDTQGRRVTAGDSIPTWSGTWGDTHINTKPADKGTSSWVALEDGSWTSGAIVHTAPRGSMYLGSTQIL